MDVLWLNDNTLTGSLPDSIGLSADLSELSLASNNLSECFVCVRVCLCVPLGVIVCGEWRQHTHTSNINNAPPALPHPRKAGTLPASYASLATAKFVDLSANDFDHNAGLPPWLMLDTCVCPGRAPSGRRAKTSVFV